MCSYFHINLLSGTLSKAFSRSTKTIYLTLSLEAKASQISEKWPSTYESKLTTVSYAGIMDKSFHLVFTNETVEREGVTRKSAE